MAIISDKSLTRVLAIATVGIAAVALSGCSLLPGGNSNPTGSGAGDTEGDDVFSIQIGDCLNDGDASGVVSKVPIVSCDEPHDSEAYDSGNLDDGDFPGDDAVKQAAEQLCGPSFTTFIGLPYDESAYDYSYYFPTEQSWDSGDREVMCIAYADDLSQVTGTLSGINR